MDRRISAVEETLDLHVVQSGPDGISDFTQQGLHTQPNLTLGLKRHAVSSQARAK